MKYGDFSQDGREYIIKRPDTPRPWINYLCTRTGDYVSLLSGNAGGYSFIKCPKDGRVTRWRYNSIPDDRPGRYIYLRNPENDDFWTLSWQPTTKPVEHYRVRHGFGYTVFECNYGGVTAEATYFVPLNETLEIWKLSLCNNTGSDLELEVYPFAEMCLGHALIDLINKPNDQHFNRLWFNDKQQTLFSTKTYWVTGASANIQENKAWDQVAFMTASVPADSYAGERERFFGSYRSENNPTAIEKGELESAAVSSGNLVSCLKLKVKLSPGEKTDLHILFGAGTKDADGELNKEHLKIIEKYRDAHQVENALEAVKSYWNTYCSSVQVETPSEFMNTSLNGWGPYQGKITFINSRNASYYHWGVHRGMGFRDSLQDTISVVVTEPELVRERLLLLAGYQREDGVCAHCFHPVSGEAEFTGHKDDPLWLITAVWYYLAETDDASVLDESVAFFKGREATLRDHLDASVSFIETNLGPDGIPTFGRGDWNDTLDFVGGEDGMGESIWAGMCYAYNLRLYGEIAAKYLQDEQKTQYLKERYEAVKRALNEHAWDGEWYLRAVCSDGAKLGSADCKEGQIYLNPQVWAVLSGVADDRKKELMKTTLAKLDTDFGPKLLAPAYHEVNEKIGLMTRCVWGKKENASIFNHTTTWALMALCEIGANTQAVDMYQRLAPASFDQDRYQIEPYVYAQYTTSDEHETFGQGSHAWLTGTAAWMFRAALDYILGIRTTLDGIICCPCIPGDWEEYKVVRCYRGTEYHITVQNDAGDDCNKITVLINDEPHPADTPFPVCSGQKLPVSVKLES